MSSRLKKRRKRPIRGFRLQAEAAASNAGVDTRVTFVAK